MLWRACEGAQARHAAVPAAAARGRPLAQVECNTPPESHTPHFRRVRTMQPHSLARIKNKTWAADRINCSYRMPETVLKWWILRPLGMDEASPPRPPGNGAEFSQRQNAVPWTTYPGQGRTVAAVNKDGTLPAGEARRRGWLDSACHLRKCYGLSGHYGSRSIKPYLR